MSIERIKEIATELRHGPLMQLAQDLSMEIDRLRKAEAERDAWAKQVWQMREALSEAANELGHLECTEEGCFCGDGWNHPAQATKKLIDSAIRAAKAKGGSV